jgi:ribosomal protein S18 acetylase RimI-like enzyme
VRPGISIRAARPDDEPCLQAIRAAAFAPVFASFRALLGDEVYDLAQRPSDDAQAGLLTSLLAGGSGWDVHVAEAGGEVVGFVAVRVDAGSRVGEIGLNAVAPAHAGRGVGTALYEFALAAMKAAGMQVATVSTGGDPSHAPARRAYEKAGFDVSIPGLWMCRRL